MFLRYASRLAEVESRREGSKRGARKKGDGTGGSDDDSDGGCSTCSKSVTSRLIKHTVAENPERYRLTKLSSSPVDDDPEACQKTNGHCFFSHEDTEALRMRGLAAFVPDSDML